MLILSWVVLAIGGYFGKRLCYDYVELKQKNYYLLQKERELENLHQVMERIRMEENTLRDYLGLEKGGK